MKQQDIRNFCIIAHIDHGKSTLADRLLEYTGTVGKREMKEQFLDQMELERERGITIKLAPATMNFNQDGTEYTLNLIDTPGHVDFTYEVSRSLAAVEGALLLVDATQGIQAQTIGNLQLARDQGLVIIPILNKIDMAGADIESRRTELARLLDVPTDEILLVSAKTGQGVEDVLKTIVKRIPSPKGDAAAALRALIFDSTYDEYKGVIAYVRIAHGTIRANSSMKFLGTGADGEALEVGIFKPARQKTEKLQAGQIGYIVTGLKNIGAARVGDTITTAPPAADIKQLPGYKEIIPMVYAGIFPKEGLSAEKLRDALEKLKLNDASLYFEPERSAALGVGFRLGLLGLLHLEIVRERLLREHGADVIVTVPSVAYKAFFRSGSEKIIKSALEAPDPSTIDRIEEPMVKAQIVAPKNYLGKAIQLAEDRRGRYLGTEYIEERAIISYEIPLAAIIVDFYDALKSATSGYGSLQYEIIGYKPADVARMDILVAEEPVEAFANLVYRNEAEKSGRRVVEILKEQIPRGQFEIKLQAKVGGKIIAAERIPPVRKDVLAKLYGGDVTRKMKLLKKQKLGKKRMRAAGRGSIEIPASAFLAVLKR